MGICEKKDCRYYSTYTNTCDFTIINSRVRPCTVKNCTEYRKREDIRTWQRFVLRKSADETSFLLADCGHEVYSGERMYVNENGIRQCPDCMEEVFRKLTTDQKACVLGYEIKAVE